MRGVGELPAFTVAAILVSCAAISYQCLDASMLLRPQNYLSPINELGGQPPGGGDDEPLLLPPIYNPGYGERAGGGGLVEPRIGADDPCGEAMAVPPVQAPPLGYPNLQGYNRYPSNGYAPRPDVYHYDKGDPSHFPRRQLTVGNEPPPSVYPFWTHIAMPHNAPYPSGLLNYDVQRKLLNPRVPTRRYGAQPGAGDLQYHYDKGEPSIMKRPPHYVPGAINGFKYPF